MVVWAGVISLLSTEWFSGEGTGQFLLPLLERVLPWLGPDELLTVHAALRKLAHLTEYAILALLVFRALADPKRSVLQTALEALLLCSAYAALDEFHQTFVRTRVGAPSDVALDSLGALFGVIAAALRLRGFSSDRRSRA